MPLEATFLAVEEHGRRLSVAGRIAVGLSLAGVAWAVRLLLEEYFPLLFFPLLFSLPAVLAAAAFGGKSGGFAATAAAMVIAGLSFDPAGVVTIREPRSMLALGLFAGNCLLITAAIETLRRSLAHTQASEAALRESERRRRTLLEEYRHRMRNDLQSMVGLLLLRMRAAAGEEAKAALRESAAHMLSLARIHRRMEGVVPGTAGPVLGTRSFVAELCLEIAGAQTAGGIRPIALVAVAEDHAIETERAVQLGLLITECVGNAFRHAFPGEAGGMISVRFWRDGASYVLAIADDGIGMAAGSGSGLNTRILRALSAQLRGVFHRAAGADGGGTAIEVRFPYLAAGAQAAA